MRSALLTAILFGLLSVTSSGAEPAPPIRVMSFNIRYGTAKDGPNHWDHRRRFLADTVKAYGPDLLGTQETLIFQRDYLAKALPEYTVIGVGRNDGQEDGETTAIYIRNERFEVVKSGTFWLSETPDVPGSKSWDSSLPRIATWAELRDRQAPDQPTVLWVNTHFDHIGVEARKNSAKLLRSRLENERGKALIVTGDFNAGENSEPYRTLFAPESSEQPPLLVDSLRAVSPAGQETAMLATFSGFDGRRREGGRIDWIGVGSKFQVVAAGIDYTDREGHTPSDHFPITAELSWKSAP